MSVRSKKTATRRKSNTAAKTFQEHFEKSLREQFALDLWDAGRRPEADFTPYVLTVNERPAYLDLTLGPRERLHSYVANITTPEFCSHIPSIWHDLLDRFEDAFSGRRYELKCIAVMCEHAHADEHVVAIYRFTAPDRVSAFAQLNCRIDVQEEQEEVEYERRFAGTRSWRAVDGRA
jgi:hypothetical protein